MTNRKQRTVQEMCRQRIVWLNWVMLGLIVLVCIVGYVKSLAHP
ncbi:MAG: hypothetical protein NZT92_14095 [Abditibacteriales bacterium]|nr:hypothetical protein [Abditibacteriales bacterium]MDW8367074.1 hypothetical protein [Abditibacteriales bacterium]